MNLVARLIYPTQNINGNYKDDHFDVTRNLDNIRISCRTRPELSDTDTLSERCHQ